MAWSRSDDTTLLHPKVLKGGRGGDDRMVNEVYGFVARCCTWSGGLLTDGFIPQEIAQVASPTRWEVLTKAAVRADMLRRRRGPDGDWGWVVVMEDQLFHVRSREEVLRDREAGRRLTRVQAISRDVRLRDGDQCRYCGKTVTFEGDRRSNRAGTYDHVIPPDQGGTEDIENIVVACGECNRLKASRTPDEAGMTLRHAPADPYYSDHTRAKFQIEAEAPTARPGTQSRTAATTRDAAASSGAHARTARDAAAVPGAHAATGANRSRTARPASDLDLPASGGGPGSGSGRVAVGSASPDPPFREPKPRSRGGRGRRTAPRPRP